MYNRKESSVQVASCIANYINFTINFMQGLIQKGWMEWFHVVFLPKLWEIVHSY